ncbi:MAG: hypothetical protein HGA52_07030 [Bacteroidales bacterium]|nr:hypothetical protein [Bacteroidales bacterium]
MNPKINNTVLFFSFLLAQMLISNFVDFGPMLFIAIYPLFIITLPTSISLVSVLLWGFAMGFSIDILYSGIAGMNTAAAVMLAFLREPVLMLFMRKGEVDSQIRPGMAEMGFSRFLVYSAISLLIFLVTIIFIESLSIDYFIGNLPRLAVSFTVNMLLLLLLEFGIFYKNWR